MHTLKNAAITIRIPAEMKRELETRAKRERRSLSAQVEHELSVAIVGESTGAKTRSGRILGLFPGRIPRESDFDEVRRSLWGGLGHRDG